MVTDSDVKIVELNPFTAQTGGCMFDWVKDKQVIENGPFEVRVVQTPSKHTDAALLPWKHLLAAALNNNPNSAAAPASDAKQNSDGCCTIS